LPADRTEVRRRLAELGPHPGQVDPRTAAEAALQDGAELGDPVGERSGPPVRLCGPVRKVLLGRPVGLPLAGGPLDPACLGGLGLELFESLGALDAGDAGTGHDHLHGRRRTGPRTTNGKACRPIAHHSVDMVHHIG